MTTKPAPRRLTHSGSVQHHLLYVPQSDRAGVRVAPDTRAEAPHARHVLEPLTHLCSDVILVTLCVQNFEPDFLIDAHYEVHYIIPTRDVIDNK